MMRIVSLSLPILLLLAACGAPAPVVRPDTPAQSEPERIEALLASGRRAEAAEAWLALAEREPAAAAGYRLQAAETWLLAGDADSAEATVAEIMPDALDRRQRARLTLVRAELALLREDQATAGWLLADSLADLPSALRPRHEMLEDWLRRLNERSSGAALRELERVVLQPDFNPELALALLIELPLAELSLLQNSHGRRPELAPWLALAVAARAHLLDAEQQWLALNDWERSHPNTGYSAEQAAYWLSLWRQSQPGPRRLAVALPGRPDMARPAAAIRDGIMTAWLEMAPSARPALRFFYVDDDAEAMLGSWFDIRAEGADFLLGPLERQAVDALAELPDPGMPVLLLNHPSRPEQLGGRFGAVRAIGLPPEEEAELAAVQALVAGHRRALVLAQNTDWGRRVASSFRATFELGGGEILAAADYDPRQVDHSAMLEVMLELDRSRQRIARLERVLGSSVEAEPQRRTDADLIFLAARADDGRQLRPQLRFFGAENLPVLSTSQIIAGAPDARRDEDLEGVMMPLPPWFMDRGVPAERRIEAERQFPELSNPALSRLFALAYDSLQLAIWLPWMADDPELYLAGWSGRLRLQDNALIERDMPFVRLQRGRAEPLLQ